MDRHRPLVLALLVLFTCASGHALQPQAPSCREARVTGRVQQGQAFEASFTDDLMFRLEPEAHPTNPRGWTIRITSSVDSQSDYAMVATPPFRFSNPRYVNSAYGITAEAALAWTPREFAFVASVEAYQSAMEALEVLLWPGNYTQAEVKQAEVALDELPTYPGRFWIEDGAATEDHQRPRDEIEWIKFRAELCSP